VRPGELAGSRTRARWPASCGVCRVPSPISATSWLARPSYESRSHTRRSRSHLPHDVVPPLVEKPLGNSSLADGSARAAHRYPHRVLRVSPPRNQPGPIGPLHPSGMCTERRGPAAHLTVDHPRVFGHDPHLRDHGAQLRRRAAHARSTQAVPPGDPGRRRRPEPRAARADGPPTVWCPDTGVRRRPSRGS
jgi:hypothetical protein